MAIEPGPGDAFQPRRLTRVKVVPTTKVDPGHAVVDWTFTVKQPCNTTGEPVSCTYGYTEMPDGGVWDVIRLPTASSTSTPSRSPVRGTTLGARLIAAARANVSSAQFFAALAPAQRTALLGSVPLPASFDSFFAGVLQQLAGPPWPVARYPRVTRWRPQSASGCAPVVFGFPGWRQLPTRPA